MLINPDANKPAQEVLFSRKKKTHNHSNISLNKIQVERVSQQKHLDLIIYEKFNFKHRQYYFKSEQGYSCIKKNSDIACHGDH